MRMGPPGRAALAAVLALLVTGCSTPGESAGPATPSAATRSATATPIDPSAAAAQYAADTPPDAAQMVCSDEIRRQVQGALGLDGTPVPQPQWADHVYTCTYAVPIGTLVLAVSVSPSVEDAGAQLDALRMRLGAADPEGDFGERAYSAPAGVLVAVKDNLVLTIDATALPDDLGVGHQRRIDVVRLLAAGVFACWTGAS